MQLRLYLNSAHHHPICRTVQLEGLTGDAILSAVQLFSESSRRESTEFAFSHLFRGEDERAESGSAVLVLDSRMRSKNVERFDFFREEWHRIRLVTEENSPELLVRNCSDGYSVWCIASLSEKGEKPRWLEAEDTLSIEKLLTALPDLASGNRALEPLSQWFE